ncbi:sugar ABC transporter ATP-binding protein [Mycolicibacterium sp. P9-22]|uniref:sugar ABC transporter ATP-binding protein n=1 Tax=Mycolicibacterium sp. P9-22 TaxID=2024613 RepID=UPI0011EF49D7|nr:sugar ABC transporter ATP-binding protein [Mycolicibacterium sp. P9-22]KAA0114676.1 sugar ABC transporter ATP-binding protein [Mycolicibacterium sp. P9-22]
MSSDPEGSVRDSAGSAPLGTVEMVGISKSYPGVLALQDVSLTMRPGTVTALAGENGAGKSTFIKTLAGAEIPDSGSILLNGQPLPSTPGAVIDAGISVIYQELTDVPDMSVLDNLLLGRQPSRFGFVDRRAARKVAQSALEQVGLGGLAFDRSLAALPIAQRQLVEIARCLTRRASVLVFDEPTSSLPENDVRGLLDTIGRLRDSGMTILYVSHHLDELFELSDQIAVLRDGRLVASGPNSQWDEPLLVQTMLAKDLEHAYPWRDRILGEVRLTVKGLTAPGVHDVSVRVAAGEIVGLVGLAGAGRTELLKAAAGLTDRSAGTVTVDNRPVPGNPYGAIAAGVVYAPEDRKGEGLVLGASVMDNLSYGRYSDFSAAGWVNRRKQSAIAADLIKRFHVKTPDVTRPVGGLSGGNQQKVVLARVAAHQPKVVLLDDPTRGVDIGAKAAIHEHVLSLAETGSAVILTSSDTDEVLAMSDRIYVLRSGRIVGEVARVDFDRERALHLAAAG